MKVTVIVLLLTSYIVLGQSQPDEEEKWKDFKTKYGKNYGNQAEEGKRKAIYKANRQTVDKHNAEYKKGRASYEMGDNQFSDLGHDEFMRTHANYKVQKNQVSNTPAASTSQASPMVGASTCPSSGDWRLAGVVTPVKDQGSCGSCYAFSAIGAVESCRMIAGKAMLTLSEQQLVDCTTTYGNDACEGGWMDNCYTYIMARGSRSAASYPYLEANGTCTNGAAAATITNFVYVAKTEAALKEAVCRQPVSVVVDASNFQFYISGVYNDPTCSLDVNHAVLVVGYGTTNAGEDYWIVKNSWGTGWGENGYIRMPRNKNNRCGIASYASYPTGCS